jgi:hypothetical protein
LTPFSGPNCACNSRENNATNRNNIKRAFIVCENTKS